MSKSSQPPSDPKNEQKELPQFVGSNVLTSQLLRQSVETTPLLEESKIDPHLLPSIAVPSLEGISIDVPAPAPVSTEDIGEQFESIYYELLERTERAEGEPIEMDDEVILDLLGYVGGELLPWSARQGIRVRMTEELLLPGFAEKLVGTPVGGHKMLQLPVGEEFGLPAHNKEHAVFVVAVRAAATLESIEADDPAMLARFERGHDLDAILLDIAEEMVEDQARDVIQVGMDMLFDILVERAQIQTLSDALIDEEIRYWWRLSEGQFLVDNEVERQDIDASFGYWLEDEEIRRDATQRLQRSIILRTFAEHSEETVTAEELQGFLETLSPLFGLEADLLAEAFHERAKEQNALLHTYESILALSRIISQVEINFPF